MFESERRERRRKPIKFKENKMPLTNKGKKILSEMKKEYGKKKGQKVFYASQNKGTIKGTHKKR